MPVENRLSSRRIDEFLGMCRSLAAAPSFTKVEAVVLNDWLEAGRSINRMPLIEEVCRALIHAKRGRYSPETLSLLRDAIVRLVGGALPGSLSPTTLPLTSPSPMLAFHGVRYCLTGTFAFGKRKQCEETILLRGGEVGELTRKTNVLVIGSAVTEAWKHSSYGVKIRQAVEWRNQRHPIFIVSEAHWLTAIERTPIAARADAHPVQVADAYLDDDVPDEVRRLMEKGGSHIVYAIRFP